MPESASPAALVAALRREPPDVDLKKRPADPEMDAAMVEAGTMDPRESKENAAARKARAARIRAKEHK